MNNELEIQMEMDIKEIEEFLNTEEPLYICYADQRSRTLVALTSHLPPRPYVDVWLRQLIQQRHGALDRVRNSRKKKEINDKEILQVKNELKIIEQCRTKSNDRSPLAELFSGVSPEKLTVFEKNLKVKLKKLNGKGGINEDI